MKLKNNFTFDLFFQKSIHQIENEIGEIKVTKNKVITLKIT
jgi:hypothetical protein